MTAPNEQINDARELLRRFLRPTRLVQAERLGRDSDTRINLKLEIDLPTGSFKPRGAIYALMKNVERRSRNGERPIRGVVAASTGNHGSAVAYAARLANIPATIFLPLFPTRSNARVSLNLVRPLRRLSGNSESLETQQRHSHEKNDYYFLNDAVDVLVPVGTATIAAEILDEPVAPDVIIVPMGDTALIRGIASEAKRRHPAVRIVGVQAAQAPSCRAFVAGRSCSRDGDVRHDCGWISDVCPTRAERSCDPRVG